MTNVPSAHADQGGELLDVVIVGAGPAGLSAALILGRCRRTILICDAGRARNHASHAVNGFLSRDGTPPAELRRIGREQLQRYETVALRDVEVVDAKRVNDRFEVTLADGSRIICRKLLLATGVVDEVPQVEGFEQLYGTSAFHCPYCDGWEVRNQPLAVYGRGKLGRGLALELTGWSRDIALCTDGPPELYDEDVRQLTLNGISIRDERVTRFDAEHGQLKRIVFADGSTLARRALFFILGERQRSDLPRRLGCTFTHRGSVRTDLYEATAVPGLYVAGDASQAVQLVIVAAAEGAKAGFAINTALLRDDLNR